MDFDIGNILYIVITLVAVLIGVLGKKKKPAEGGSGSSQGGARSGFLENLERVLTMDQEPPRIHDLQDYEEDLPAEEYDADEVLEEIQPQTVREPGLMEKYEQLMKRDSNLLVSEGGLITEALEVIDLDERPGTDYFRIIDEFDAGTAIVYSAIINRLDY